MARDKPRIEQPKQTTRERVLDAAERLLMEGSAAFSMRELAEEAGMSFATPFNQFGSKAAIMLALSARRIDTMRDSLPRLRFLTARVERVLMAVDIAASVMLSAPAMNRAVMGCDQRAERRTWQCVFRAQARFGAEALGAAAGLAPATRSLAMAVLPDQLAVAFRGVLSFWTAGELSDHLLSQRAPRCGGGGPSRLYWT